VVMRHEDHGGEPGTGPGECEPRTRQRWGWHVPAKRQTGLSPRRRDGHGAMTPPQCLSAVGSTAGGYDANAGL
jgi:hypothetical protein